MAKENKGGKVAISKKEDYSSSDFDHLEFDFNPINIDPELKAELDSKGLVPRWMNAKQFVSNGNVHSEGFRPYKPDLKEGKGALDYNFGISPDGYVQRNDLILGVKPVEQHERYQAHIRRKADMMSGVGRQRADELRSSLKEAGVKGRVLEGYDDNE